MGFWADALPSTPAAPQSELEQVKEGLKALRTAEGRFVVSYGSASDRPEAEEDLWFTKQKLYIRREFNPFSGASNLLPAFSAFPLHSLGEIEIHQDKVWTKIVDWLLGALFFVAVGCWALWKGEWKLAAGSLLVGVGLPVLFCCNPDYRYRVVIYSGSPDYGVVWAFGYDMTREKMDYGAMERLFKFCKRLEELIAEAKGSPTATTPEWS